MTEKTATILVVDDEATIRNFIVRVLEREGYRVESAADGQAAYERLQAEHFDVLLTDIKMNYMDGVGLLRLAKRAQPDLAVILFTGHATVQTAVEALRNGAFEYLLKPVKNQHIVETVEKALRYRETEQRRDRLESLASQILDAFEPGSKTAAATTTDTLTVGPLRLDLAAFQSYQADKPVALTPTEFRLLATLAQQPGHVFNYVTLVEEACGYTCPRNEARQIIGTHVINLRNKLNIDADEVGYVASVRGVGYRLITETSEKSPG
jgi:DNA-binding response OmpR family regulator